MAFKRSSFKLTSCCPLDPQSFPYLSPFYFSLVTLHAASSTAYLFVVRLFSGMEAPWRQNCFVLFSAPRLMDHDADRQKWGRKLVPPSSGGLCLFFGGRVPLCRWNFLTLSCPYEPSLIAISWFDQPYSRECVWSREPSLTWPSLCRELPLEDGQPSAWLGCWTVKS